MFPAPEGTPAPTTEQLLGDLDALRTDLVGPAPKPEAPTVLHAAPAPEAPGAPGAGQVIEGVAPAEPPVAPGGDESDGGEPPEAPAPAPALSVEEQYAKLGEPITRARAAREADKAALPERQRKFLDSRGEVQRAVGEAAGEAAPLRLDDDQRSRLEGLQGKLGILYERVTPLPDSLVAEKAGRRGALSETDVAVRQETVAKWNEEIVCQQAVLESLDVEGKVRVTQEAGDAYNGLVGAHKEVGAQARKAARELAKAEKALAADQDRMKTLVDMGGLTAEEAELILEKKPAGQQKAAAELEMARLEQEAAIAKQRAVEAKAKADGLRAEEEVARAAAREVEGMIGQRRAGIDMAVAEMTVSDQVTERTRQQLVKAGEKIARSQRETGQKLEANRVAGDIQEMQAFVDRIAGVRILPGGLENQLRLLDQRIDYLRQPGAVVDLDPALAGAVEFAVDMAGGGDDGRKRCMEKLVADRTNLQVLRDIANDPNSLIDAPYYVPDVLRQAVREVQAESAGREKKQEEGKTIKFMREGGAGVGFLEGGSDDPIVNNLYELRRGVAAKFVESLGLQVPAGLAEQELLQQVGAELRTMLESDQPPAEWEEIYKHQDIREESKKQVAEAEARVAEANKRVEELTSQLEEEIRLGGKKVAGLESKLAAAQELAAAEQQRAEAMAPVVGEVDRQIQAAYEAVPEEIKNLMSESERSELNAELQPGEKVEERVAKMQEAAQKALEQKLGTETREGDAEHQKLVGEMQRLMQDRSVGDLSNEEFQQKLRQKAMAVGKGTGNEEKFKDGMAKVGLAIVDAQVAQMKRLKNMSGDEAKAAAGQIKGMNTVLEGAGFLVGGMGGLLDGGFQLAIQTMFGGK